MHSNSNNEPIKRKSMSPKVARRFFHKNQTKLAKLKMLGQSPSPSMLKRMKEATRVLLMEVSNE